MSDLARPYDVTMAYKGDAEYAHRGEVLHLTLWAFSAGDAVFQAQLQQPSYAVYRIEPDLTWRAKHPELVDA